MTPTHTPPRRWASLRRDGFWTWLSVAVIRTISSVVFRRRWHHLARIPRQGGALVVVNHISVADTMAVARLVWDAGRLPHFLIWDEVFTWPIVGRAFRGCGQIPVVRASVRASDALDHAIAALRQGHVVVIYPEGGITRRPDGWPMAARTGAARLALACPDVPVIPVGQWGAHETWRHRPGRRAQIRPFPRKVAQASVGEPVDLGGMRTSGKPDQTTLRLVTEILMDAVTREVEQVRGETRPDETRPDLAG